MPRGRPRKQPVEASDGQYFVLGKQLPVDANLIGIPGDCGVLIDSARFTMKVPRHRFDQLTRLYGLSKWKGKNASECGKCGLKFVDEASRDAHGERRHNPKPGPIVKDFSELSPEQQQQISDDAGQPNLTRRDAEYYVNHNDFVTPDPTDRTTSADDRALAQNIDWDKTAASRT